MVTKQGSAKKLPIWEAHMKFEDNFELSNPPTQSTSNSSLKIHQPSNHTHNTTAAPPTMADPTTPLSPIREIQISALVAMRIIKHSTSAFPTPATGCLVGMDVPSTSGTQLQITNSFPYPASIPETSSTQQDQSYQQQQAQSDPAALAAAAPRAKSNVAYQNEMIKLMREVNVDAQAVGWYISTSMGNFVNLNFVENQAYFQKLQPQAPGDERTGVALVFDVSRSVAGSLTLKAYRLGEKFLVAWREGKFSTERYCNPFQPHLHTRCSSKYTRAE